MAPFTSKLRLKNRNLVRNCKRCARSVCEVCSESKRQLSKNDPTMVRVCDRCDYEMDNFILLKNLEGVKNATNNKIMTLNSHLELFNASKIKLSKQQETNQEDLNQQLEQKRL